MSLRLTLLAFTTALVVAAPVSAKDADPDGDARQYELLQANAGEPVERVRFLRPVDSYEVVGEHAVLVWETPHKAWLVDLRPSAACQDLDRGWSISLETAHDTLNTSNGYVVSDRHHTRCKMTRIREVDVPAYRAAERESDIAGTH